ncbi:MAG: hypothetical protein ACYC9O_13230 [Candidatus Latescibacterota bacterium]
MTNSLRWRIFLLVLFAIAMGCLEATVVVYLRALYYPEGFSFPLKLIPADMAIIEIGREAATIVMLITLAGLAGRRFWERFGNFIIAFGTWDIFYYIWLKVTLDWPASLFDSDILFLIPLPWVGPVIAPSLVSLLLIGIGVSLLVRSERGDEVRFPGISRGLGATGIIIILYTFIRDYRSVTEQRLPESYPYLLFGAGLVLVFLAYLASLQGMAIKRMTKE